MLSPEFTDEQPPLSDNAPPTRTTAIRHDFERDAIGRLVSKRTEDGTTDYRYDAADNLLSITFTDNKGEKQQLDYTYDANGQLLSETNSAGLLQYRYDELGNLQTLVLPDQRELNHLYYGSGHLHQINLNGRVISDFERDAVHDEVLRTQGKLVTRTRYDTSGRLAGKAIHYRDAPAEVLPLLDKAYRYDASDNLVAEVLTQTQRRGMTNAANDEDAHLEQIIGRFLDLPHTGKTYSGHNRYGYDLNEQLQTVQQSRPNWQATQVEDFKYDKAGNLFDGPKLNGLIKHNRVLVYQDKRYRYDRFGRLCEKRIGSNWVQYFEYDAEQRLICVEQYRSGERERVVFAYDPLGRRISKEVYQRDYPEPRRRVLFHWQGLRLLQEVQSGLASLYVYATVESYDPLARVDGKPGSEAVHYFHTKLAGLPEQLSSSDGKTIWQNDHQGLGNTPSEWHSPQQAREQNLRFQGQYLDRETGLHYNTLRFYDPDIGRFTTSDPIGLEGGLNLYRFAPNTNTWFDPLGLSPLFPGEGEAGVFGKLPGAPGDNLTGHHMPSAAYMKRNFGISPQKSVAMQMEHIYPSGTGRHSLTRTFKRAPLLSESPRDALARDIWDARKIYRKENLYNLTIKQGLRNSIHLNKSLFPDIFQKNQKDSRPCP
ncbi:RHS repeat domain-containing protein [Pseudomonas hunanensis]|uniref:RHS repeat domain-containing protein n=1 Tax=Pseudomonas hunanensis TaxID=1247546 RepID=UPI003BB50C43